EARRAVASRDGPALRALANKAGSEQLTARLALLLAEQEAVPSKDRLRLLREARDRFPDDVALAFQLGVLLAVPVGPLDPWALAEPEGAFRAILARQPGTPAAWNNLGMVLRDRKARAGALAACRKAVELDPDDAVTQNNLGLLLLDRKDLAGARAA